MSPATRLILLPARLLPTVMFALAALIAVPAVAHDPAANHVVMQVSDADPAKWTLALNNARNLQADLGTRNVEIEIVAYGPGIGMLKLGSAVASRLDEAIASGIKVAACENTMRGQNLARADMLPNLEYVPAGVTEIMKKQQQGWSYIRP
jgi:intracellular sulfur oxidation DsrE/DsrF family protein